MLRFATAPIRNALAVRTIQNWSVAASAPLLAARFNSSSSNSGSSTPEETTPAQENTDSGSGTPSGEEKPREDTWNALHLPFCL